MNGSILTPLIERILVLGVSYEDLKRFFSIKKVELKELKTLQIKILEEYKSNNLKETSKESYIENIPTFCFPDGIAPQMTLDDPSISFIAFTLLADSQRRKQCTCLTFYENYKEDEYIFGLPKAIVLVSSMELFSTHKEILLNIYQIISRERRKNSQIRYVYLKEKSQYCVYQELRILEFYFSFLLNTLSFSKEDRLGSSYYINYIGNNTGRKCFLRCHLDDMSSFPVKDYDLTLLLDSFSVEDLIQIYLGLIMEYKLILIFDDYESINTILFSLISLIYPLNWKLLPIISFLTDHLLETLEAPFPIIIGAHLKYIETIMKKINENVMTEETIIYNLTTKKFIFISDKFPQLPVKMTAELKSGIYLVLSEKLAIHSDVANSETELKKMFPVGDAFQKIEPMIYLNYKFTSVFFGIFLELIKNLESCIYFNKVKAMKVAKKDRMQISEQFDFAKFSKDRDYYNEPKYVSFIKHFTTTMMLPELINKYIKHHCNDKKPKYKLLKKLITVLNTKDNGKNLVKDMLREHIKKKIVTYYKFRYVSLEDGFKSFIGKLGNLSQSSNSISQELTLWSPLETYKIINFSVNYKEFLLDEEDRRVRENFFNQLHIQLSKFLCDKKAIREYDENSELSTPCPKTIIHRQTPSLGSIINCDNNIENYFFNNINISADGFSKAIPLLETSACPCSHLTTNPNITAMNTINNTISSIKSTSMNTQVLHGSNPVVNENPTSRNLNINFITESLSNGIRFDTYQKINTAGNVNVKSSVDNEASEYKINSGVNELNMNMVQSSLFKQHNRKKNASRTINFDLLQKIGKTKKLIREPSAYLLKHHHQPQMSLMTSANEVLPKLAGDEECDIFSDSEK